MTEATAMPSVLSPANDQMVTVTVEALAKDNSGGVDWRVFSISCNKPHTADDLSFINDNTVQLRAAKSADGEDRIYTVWVRAEDAAGNLSQPKSILITVPHDRSNKRR